MDEETAVAMRTRIEESAKGQPTRYFVGRANYNGGYLVRGTRYGDRRGTHHNAARTTTASTRYGVLGTWTDGLPTTMRPNCNCE